MYVYCLVTTSNKFTALLVKIGSFVEHLSLEQIDSIDPDDAMFGDIELNYELFPNIYKRWA